MPTYTAEFHTDAEWALLDIKAATPEKALAKARAVDPLTLDFQPYDDLQPVNYIAIRDKDCNDLAEWQHDDLWLQKAAPQMLSFIRQIAEMTMDGEPINDGHDTYYDFEMENDDAVSTLHQLIEKARDLEAKAKGGAA